MSYLDFIETQLKQAGAIAMSHFGNVNPITKPEDNNQVLTEADIAIGQYLIQAITKAFPDHSIIDEEAGAIDKNSDFIWVIDPVEATSNFAAGTDDWGIMLGLLKNEQPFAGGVIVPKLDRTYLAQKDLGATLNGKSIKVSSLQDLNKALISYSLDGYLDNPERTYRECQIMADIALACRNIRNTNCEATDGMYVADGRYGGRVNTTSKIWDNVAPQIIVEEAGGLWTAADGQPIDYSDPLNKIGQNYNYCAANPALHAKLIEIIDGRLS